MKKILITMAAIAAISVFLEKAEAQTTLEHFHEEIGDREILIEVILNHLTIWTRPDGTPVYHRNCRTLTFGCEQQIATYVDYIFAIAYEQDIDPWFLAAVAWHESRFNAFAESSAGAIGLFQILRRGAWSRGLPFIHSRWYRERCRTELGSCQYRLIRRAVYWLTASFMHCGSVRDGLRMYNSGRCDGPRGYARAVFNTHEEFLAEAEQIRERTFGVEDKYISFTSMWDYYSTIYNKLAFIESNVTNFMCTYSDRSYYLSTTRSQCFI